MFDGDLEIIILEPLDYVVIDIAPQIIDLSGLGSRDYQEFEAQVVHLTNKERTERGLHALIKNVNLSQSALAHALDMAENHFISHTGSDNSKVSHRVTRTDYRDWIAVGENLAMGQRTPEQAVHGWMTSTGHRKNLLSDKFYEIGVAYVEGDILSPDGVLWRGGYWVQNFGARLEHIGSMAAKLWKDVTFSAARSKEDGVEIVIIDEGADEIAESLI